MTRVLLAMSGGVDSSVAALLLCEQGLEVVGVFMRNGVSEGHGAAAKSCCSASDAQDAARVAAALSVPFYAVDYADEFSGIIDFFAAEYRRGRTPNPCVLCNQQLKFGQLFSLAEAVGAEAVATGHYARIEDGRLLRAADADKDQTYYLFGVERQALARVRFPLGGLHKREVRAIARARGLGTADKAESMEICFVTSGDYRDVVRARAGGGAGRTGAFLDEAGAVLGEHGGVANFTVGQRRGLPALGAPHYVKEIRAASGEVVLCRREGLARRAMSVRGVNWLCDLPASAGGDDPDGSGLVAEVKIRARARPQPARLRWDPARLDRVSVDFDEPVSAVTPGQAAVFYAGDIVLGGGFID